MVKTLRGTIPFDSLSEDMGYREVLRPGCFDRFLATEGDVLARMEHDSKLLLGRRSSGTLRLTADQVALHYEVDVPDTSTGRDLSVLCSRNDINATSFAFYVADASGERWSVKPDGTLLRELLDLDLVDVSPVSSPCYPSATVRAKELMSRTLRRWDLGLRADAARAAATMRSGVRSRPGDPHPMLLLRQCHRVAMMELLERRHQNRLAAS
jgi:HK97 family phage prohead protease